MASADSSSLGQSSNEGSKQRAHNAHSIFAKGEMAERMRDFAWENTAIGGVELWSDLLLITVNTLLASRTPMFLWWGDDLIQFYNDAYRLSLGSEKHPEALGQPGKECWPEIWSIIGPQIDSVRREGVSTWNENQLVPIYRDGVLEDVYWTYSYSPVRELDGSIQAVLVTCSETTDQIKAERRMKNLFAELQKSEERLRLALSTAKGIGTWDWEIATNRVFADERFSQAYGVDPAWGAEGAPIREFTKTMHPDDRARVEEEIAGAIESGEDFHSEYRLIQEDGSIRWVLARGRCTYAPDGSPLRFPGVTLDISDQKRLAANAAETEKHLALAVDGAGVATWYYDPARSIVGGDKRMSELFGLEFQEGPVEIWLAAIHQDDRNRVAREFSAGSEGEPYDTEYRVCKKNGAIRWVRAKAQFIKGTGGSRMVGICEDFSERKANEENLRDTATRLSLAQQTGKMAAWQWDLASGNFVWDEGSGWTYGRPPSEMTHVDMIFPYLHEEDREKVRRALLPAIEGWGEYRSEFRVIWPDGSLHWIQAFGKGILSAEGKPTAIVGINMDITERKLAEGALMQTEKLAAVGRLASSIAHEINNPLESVTNLLYLARSASNPNDLDVYLEGAERELRRVSAITNQTLRFYRQTTNPSAVSCSALFQEALSLFQGRLLNSNIRVEQMERATRPALCLVGEVRQVLSNLIGNAIDAMPNGGRLLLRSREATRWKTGEKGFSLTVADNGSGMPQHVRKKIFDAFFSTKGIGGTGLGLWVSKELVEKNRGTLSVRTSTSSKHGTVFVLFFPFTVKIH